MAYTVLYYLLDVKTEKGKKSEIIEFQRKSNDYTEYLESHLANVSHKEIVLERSVV